MDIVFHEGHDIDQRIVHVCGCCMKGFRRIWCLMWHIRCIERVAHACGSCGKGFHWVSNLKKHMIQWFVLVETAEGDIGELSI